MKKIILTLVTIASLISCNKKECNNYKYKLDDLYASEWQANYNYENNPTQSNKNHLERVEQEVRETEKAQQINCN